MNSSDSIGHSRRGSCPVPVAEDGAKRSKFVDERCQSMLLFVAAAGCIDERVVCSAVLLVCPKLDQSVVWVVVVGKAGMVR